MGLMCTRWKSHISELMLLYEHPVGPGMTTGEVFNNPHAVDSIATVLVLLYLISPHKKS